MRTPKLPKSRFVSGPNASGLPLDVYGNQAQNHNPDLTPKTSSPPPGPGDGALSEEPSLDHSGVSPRRPPRLPDPALLDTLEALYTTLPSEKEPSGLRALRSRNGLVLALAPVVLVAAAYFLWRYDTTGGAFPSSFGSAMDNNTQLVAPIEATGNALLSILSNPPGASISIDFDSVGPTPLRDYPLTSGVYVISLHQPGYTPLDTVVFIQEGQQLLTFTLVNHPSYLSTGTDGAAFNGLPRGQRTHLPAVPQTTAREQAQPVVQPQQPRPGNTRTRASGASGILLATSEPMGGVLYLDGVAQGETPLLLEDVPTGRRSIEIRKKGYTSFEGQVEVSPGVTTKISGQLQALSGSLSVLVQPWGSIYIDGQLHRQDTDVQYQTTLPVGTHVVRVVHPTLGTWERTVEITGGASQQVYVNFQRDAGSLPAPNQSLADNAEPSTAAAATDENAEVPTAVVDESGIYLSVEENPQPIGGWQKLYSSAVYPTYAREAGIEGRVYLRYVVDENGRVQNATVVRGIEAECDREALRLIRNARFTPGKVQGQPVKVWQATYVSFDLDGR